MHEAIVRRTTVKIFGERHSQTDIICTEGIPVDSRGLRFFRINNDGVTATFGSGVNLRDATEFLRKHGRGLRTTPAYGNITLGNRLLQRNINESNYSKVFYQVVQSELDRMDLPSNIMRRYHRRWWVLPLWMEWDKSVKLRKLRTCERFV